MESVQPKYVPISTLAKIWGRSRMYIYRRIDMIRNEGKHHPSGSNHRLSLVGRSYL